MNYQGKRTEKGSRFSGWYVSGKVTLLLTVMLTLSLIGGTLAYLVASAEPITNTFTPITVTTDIDEGFDKEVKSNVKVKNTGDTEAYIRAAVVVTWQNENGEVYLNAPVEGTDYTVDWTMDGWMKIGNYYYHKAPVEANDSTGILFTGCKLKDDVTPPDGYYLNVEILASAIQSQPTSTVENAWKVVKVDENRNLVEVKEGGSAE